jgi:hypothetical protein
MPSLKHTHSYVRRGSKGLAKKEKLWKCADPNCTHFTTREDVLGKLSLCPNCMTKEFVLTHEDLRRAKPKCKDCANTAEAEILRRHRQVLAELGLG